MILDYLASKTICSNDLVVVSPDVGGVARARAFAKKLSDAPLAIVDKRRHGHNVAEVIWLGLLVKSFSLVSHLFEQLIVSLSLISLTLRHQSLEVFFVDFVE